MFRTSSRVSRRRTTAGNAASLWQQRRNRRPVSLWGVLRVAGWFFGHVCVLLRNPVTLTEPERALVCTAFSRTVASGGTGPAMTAASVGKLLREATVAVGPEDNIDEYIARLKRREGAAVNLNQILWMVRKIKRRYVTNRVDHSTAEASNAFDEIRQRQTEPSPERAIRAVDVSKYMQGIGVPVCAKYAFPVDVQKQMEDEECLLTKEAFVAAVASPAEPPLKRNDANAAVASQLRATSFGRSGPRNAKSLGFSTAEGGDASVSSRADPSRVRQLVRRGSRLTCAPTSALTPGRWTRQEGSSQIVFHSVHFPAYRTLDRLQQRPGSAMQAQQATRASLPLRPQSAPLKNCLKRVERPYLRTSPPSLPRPVNVPVWRPFARPELYEPPSFVLSTQRRADVLRRVEQSFAPSVVAPPLMSSTIGAGAALLKELQRGGDDWNSPRAVNVRRARDISPRYST